MNWILDRKVTLLRSVIFVVLVVYGTLAGKYSDLDYSVITSQLDNLKGDYLSVSTAHSRYDHQVVQEVRMKSSQRSQYRFMTTFAL